MTLVVLSLSFFGGGVASIGTKGGFGGPGEGCYTISIGWMRVNTTRVIGGGVGG